MSDCTKHVYSQQVLTHRIYQRMLFFQNLILYIKSFDIEYFNTLCNFKYSLLLQVVLQ